MSLEDECNIAARYRTVRKHLDSLGYKHALTLDSLPLIEKLLADLIQTTESLKHFKSIAQENIEVCAFAVKSLFFCLQYKILLNM